MKRAGKTRCRGCQFEGAAKPESLAWRGAGEAVKEGVSNAVVDRVLGRDLSGSLRSGRMARGRMVAFLAVENARPGRDGMEGQAEPGGTSGPTASAAHAGIVGVVLTAPRRMTTCWPVRAASPLTRSRVLGGTRARLGRVAYALPDGQRTSRHGAARAGAVPWLGRSAPGVWTDLIQKFVASLKVILWVQAICFCHLF